VRVKTRAVIWIDGLLIVAEQSRQGYKELTLPGGRVNDHESVIDVSSGKSPRKRGWRSTPGGFSTFRRSGSRSGLTTWS